MGKKGHLTCEKKTLNIRVVRPHPTHLLRYTTVLALGGCFSFPLGCYLNVLDLNLSA